jgi:hypothetical protein
MARYKLYLFGDQLVKGFNKEDVRRKLHLSYTKLKFIKRIWCRSHKRGSYDLHNK